VNDGRLVSLDTVLIKSFVLMQNFSNFGILCVEVQSLSS